MLSVVIVVLLVSLTSMRCGVVSGAITMNAFIGEDKYIFNTNGVVYVLANIHGDYDAFKHVLCKGGIIDDDWNWIASRDTYLVQLGDVMGIGPFGQLIIDRLINLREDANNKGGKVILLMGLYEYISGTNIYSDEFEFDGDDNRVSIFNNKSSIYYNYIRTLKMAVVINGAVFTHAGLTPYDIEIYCGTFRKRKMKRGERCLRRMTHEMIKYIPNIENGEHKPSINHIIERIRLNKHNKYIFKDIYNMYNIYNIERLRESIPHTLNTFDKHIIKHTNKITYSNETEQFCKQLNELLDSFDSKIMFIGNDENEPQADDPDEVYSNGKITNNKKTRKDPCYLRFKYKEDIYKKKLVFVDNKLSLWDHTNGVSDVFEHIATGKKEDKITGYHNAYMIKYSIEYASAERNTQIEIQSIKKRYDHQRKKIIIRHNMYDVNDMMYRIKNYYNK
eukprot:GHVR01036782.1.p1 GENE.GHVR01036782.1~~GHVR01036782.1.p1  ORF type:complete len:447 (-),score=87.20 GHVR01036782.1:120-1460(-)